MKYGVCYWVKVTVRTLFKNNLEFVGPYNLIVCRKIFIKQQEAIDEPSYVLEVETDEDNYTGFIFVSNEQYRLVREGEVWKSGGVILHKKHKNWCVITENTDAKTSIHKQVVRSRIAFSIIVVALVIFLYPFLTSFYI